MPRPDSDPMDLQFDLQSSGETQFDGAVPASATLHRGLEQRHLAALL
jgi:hypothetical protein